MNKQELIGKLQMVYIGDKNALNEMVGYYDGLKESIEHLKQENKKQKKILDEIYNHCESRINVCKSLQSDDEWECCIAELDGVISILKEVE
jgi:hypothetical protein|nr:MAG TPA: hypothetical protein [Caudoviricetes sp.]